MINIRFLLKNLFWIICLLSSPNLLNAQTPSQYCYHNGEQINLLGTVRSEANMKGPNNQILQTNVSVCIVSNTDSSLLEITDFHIIGMPAPEGAVLQISGILKTDESDNGNQATVSVLSGRKILGEQSGEIQASQPSTNADLSPNTPPVLEAPSQVIASPQTGQNATMSNTTPTTNNSESYSGSILVIFIVSIITLWVLSSLWNERLRFQKAHSLITQHAGDLSIRKKQLTIPGPYGVVNIKPWATDMSFFYKNIIVPITGEFSEKQAAKLGDFINLTASTHTGGKPKFSKMTPIEYEASVAVRLQEIGWDARITTATGDQGIDVIAVKNGIKIVIQCKLYSSPVGNSAVQEIIAGRVFENANFAAVVSNVGYTKAARQLAVSAQVFLLHHDEVSNIDEKLGLI